MRIVTRLVMLLGLLAVATAQVQSRDAGQLRGPAPPLIRAHAHNDYHHSRLCWMRSTTGSVAWRRTGY